MSAPSNVPPSQDSSARLAGADGRLLLKSVCSSPGSTVPMSTRTGPAVGIAMRAAVVWPHQDSAS